MNALERGVVEFPSSPRHRERNARVYSERTPIPEQDKEKKKQRGPIVPFSDTCATIQQWSVQKTFFQVPVLVLSPPHFPTKSASEESKKDSLVGNKRYLGVEFWHRDPTSPHSPAYPKRAGRTRSNKIYGCQKKIGTWERGWRGGGAGRGEETKRKIYEEPGRESLPRQGSRETRSAQKYHSCSGGRGGSPGRERRMPSGAESVGAKRPPHAYPRVVVFVRCHQGEHEHQPLERRGRLAWKFDDTPPSLHKETCHKGAAAQAESHGA